MDRSVIENLVVHHGLAHDWELDSISDSDLAVLADIVGRKCETGRIQGDTTKLVTTLLILSGIAALLYKVQPIIDNVLYEMVQNSGLIGIGLIVLVPVFLLFVVVPTFHKAS